MCVGGGVYGNYGGRTPVWKKKSRLEYGFLEYKNNNKMKKKKTWEIAGLGRHWPSPRRVARTRQMVEPRLLRGEHSTTRTLCENEVN